MGRIHTEEFRREAVRMALTSGLATSAISGRRRGGSIWR